MTSNRLLTLLLTLALVISDATAQAADKTQAAVPSKVEKATQVLNYFAAFVQTPAEEQTTIKAALEPLAEMYARELDPSNKNWNPSHPRWQRIVDVVRSDLQEGATKDAKEKGDKAHLAMIRGIADRIQDTDLDDLLRYFKTDEGKRYLKFQEQINVAFLRGMFGMMKADEEKRALTPDPNDPEQKITQRRRLLALSFFYPAIQEQSEDGKAQHPSTTDLASLEMVMGPIAHLEKEVLDQLANQYLQDINKFEHFNQSPAAQHFYRTLNGLLAESKVAVMQEGLTFGSEVKAKHIDQWQRIYQKEVGGAANVTVAALAATSKPTFKPGDVFRHCAECPEMVVIPAGRFIMGSPETEVERVSNEGPQHDVTIRSFAAGKYDVTFDEWDACVAAGGCGGYRPGDQGWGRGSRPVIRVDWNGAQKYALWLSKKTGKRYRLLSESEWEYAARAGTTTPFYTGNCINTAQANYRNHADYNHCGANGGVDRAQTTQVGSFAPNSFGLYDMIGNVQQWVDDCWHNDYVSAPTDGSAWQENTCDSRVLRGGSFKYLVHQGRSAARNRVSPRFDYETNGFRIAMTLD